nr:retrovirus-related Pol polyprotein from transposon TNT 1-94 [Tanacetum cinerariifolium]
MATIEVPQTLEYRSGQLNAAPTLKVENFTNWRYKALMNELVNDDIKLLKLEINTGFINGLPKKWLSFCRSLRNTNHVKDSELASLFGKLKYEENLRNSIYKTEKNKSLVSAIPLLTAFFFTSIVQDFQDSPYNKEDTRSSHEYLNDLEEEYQARAILANSKRFVKKGTQRSSASKAFMVRNNGLITEAYEWDEEEVSSDDNEMVEVKVLMALAEENNAVSKECAKNVDDTKVNIPGVERPWLSEAEGFILPNYDTDESSVYNIPLPPLKELDGAEPISRPKTIKSILSPNHTTTDHYDIEWFKKGEPHQAKKAEALKSTGTESSNANRSKTPTKRHMTGVKSYLHKCMEQPGPKVVFGDDSTCTTKGDVYVLDMTSSDQESCFFAKAFENLNWLWHKRLAHLNFKTINKLAKQKLVSGLPSFVYSKDKPCSSCEKVKHHRVYIYNHKDHLRKFDEKADDGYLLGYSLVSQEFRVFNTRRQQTKETYHITFDESPKAIKFLKSLIDNINIAES